MANERTVTAKWSTNGIESIKTKPFSRAIVRALRKAGSTALRDMKSESAKRIKARKRIKSRFVTKSITVARPKGTDISSMSWKINVSGDPVPLTAYPVRQIKKGVIVEVNKGKRTLLKGSFIASMKSGHRGVFARSSKNRLPIEERVGSRPVDALLHKGESEGVANRGAKSLSDTFSRLLPLELGK